MKFNIQGFSQVGLQALGLDNTDAHFLRWFKDLTKSGKMKTIQSGEKKFFWVNYCKLIEEFPLAGITNKKSVANRFMKYVHVGLLERKIVKVQGGTMVYFAYVGDKLDKLSYTGNGTKTNKVEISKSTDKFSHDNTSNCARNKVYKGAKIGGIEVSSLILESQKKLDSCVKIPHKNFNSGPHKNLDSGVLNNPSTNLNPSTTNSVLHTHAKQEVLKLFGSGRLKNDIWDKLDAFANENNFTPELITDYVKFAYLKANEPNIKSCAGFFYTNVCTKWLYDEFLTLDKASSKKTTVEKHICKGCNIEFGAHKKMCDECGLKICNEDKPAFVKFARDFVALDKEKKDSLVDELADLSFNVYKEKNKAPMHNEIAKVYKAYGLIYPKEMLTSS